MAPRAEAKKWNLGNIRKVDGQRWRGEVPCIGPFVCFESKEYSYRAVSKILQTYYYKHGLDTLEGIMDRYCPPEENDTESVVRTMVRLTGYLPREHVDITDMVVRDILVRAIIRIETGHDYEDTL